MKKISLVLLYFSLLFFSACKPGAGNPEQIIRSYYKGLNKANFDLVADCVSDGIITAEMEYTLTKNKSELYHQFQWDSVFQPEYKIVDIKNDSLGYMATLSKVCKRIYFLQDTAITFNVRFDFTDRRISSIRLTEYGDLNFDKWQYRTEALIAWIDQNHPELSGFNNDLTKAGAQHYLKAVDLWKKEITP